MENNDNIIPEAAPSPDIPAAAAAVKKPNPVLRFLSGNWDFILVGLLTAYVWIFCYGPAFTFFLAPVIGMTVLFHRKTIAFFKDFRGQRGGYIIAAFLFPALIMLGAYLIFGVFPVGDMSVLVLDLNGQYVYYHENLWDVCHGNGSFFISWSRNLSGELMGIYAYYLASPFTMIIMLLPRTFMANSLLIMQLCKVGSAGLVFYLYVRRLLTNGYRTEKSNITINSLIFSTLYALMAYMVVQLMDPMWLDGLILLPIICYGIEQLIEEGRKLWVIIPLASMFIANFYIGWMLAIFSIIYFLTYYFALKRDETFRFGDFFKKGVGFAVSGITAAAVSASILLPLYYSLNQGKLEFTTPNYTLKTQFVLGDFFSNLLPKAYDTVRPEGTPVVYCGIIILILVPLFFMNSKISFRTKAGYGALSAVLILSMYLSTVDLVWHGLQVPNWLPYRYSFCLSFALILMAAQAFERLDGVSVKQIGGTFFALMAYILYLDKQEITYLDTMNAIWISLIGVVIYSLMIYTYKKKDSPIAVSIFLMAIIIAEMLDSSYYTVTAIQDDVVYSKYSSYGDYITQGRQIISDLKKKDTGLYRIEKNFHRTVNDAMAFGSYGLSHSSSTLNATVIDMLEDLGFACGGHYIRYKGATPVTDSIFGIKYVIAKDDKVSYTDVVSSTEVKTKSAIDTWSIYNNPDALPIAFMADDSVTNVNVRGMNPFENQNKLLNALISGDSLSEYFRPLEWSDWDKTFENVTSGYYSDHKKYTVTTSGQNAQIMYHLKAQTNDMLYMYFPTVYERKVNVWVNEEFIDTYFEGGNTVILPLGRFEPGQEVNVGLTLVHEKDETLFQDEYFYYFDEALFKEDIEKLKQRPALNISSFTEDHIIGSVDADAEGTLFTTISNEPGWTVFIDGKEAEIIPCVEDALIGIHVPAGHHEIEMKFLPAGFKLGVIISAAGVCFTIILALLERRRRVKLERLL